MVLDSVDLKYDHEGIIKVRRHDPNAALTYIRKLLEYGFRGNKYYYRDNDERLCLKVWEHEGLILTAAQKKKFLYETTKARTIVRRRSELRAEFPDSPKVQAKRYNLFLEKKDEYSEKGILKRLLKT